MLLISFLYLTSLIIWIGGIVFFSFITAPALFKSLPPELAGKAVGAIFPKYYPLGTVSGFVALFCTIFSAVKTGHWAVFKMILLLTMITLTVYGSLVLHPRARAIKEEMQSDTGSTDITLLKKEFDHAHQVSVIYNGIVLFLGLVLVIVTARNLIL